MGVYGKTFAQFNTHQAIDHQTFVFPNGVTVSGGNQTMNCNYQVGNVDVFVRGIKMAESEFTADDGTSVSIPVATLSMTTGDEITIIGRKYPTADIMNSGAVNISGGQVNNTTMNNATMNNSTLTNANASITAGTIGSSVTVQAGSPIAVQLASSQSSSATTQVDFDNTIVTSSYKTYRICINNVIPATDVTEPYIYLSVNNGSSFIANIDSRRMYHKFTDTNSYGQEKNQDSGYIQIGTDLGNDADEGFFGHCDLFGITLTTTNWAGGYANCMGRHGSDTYWWDNGIHIEKGVADAINFIRFKMSSGDMAEHDISLWGFK